MRPTRLELALGNLVMLVKVTSDQNVSAVIRRAAGLIEIRWYNGEPYVRDTAPCEHHDLTTRWTRSKSFDMLLRAEVEMKQVETTCDACGETINLFGKGD